jgi:transposase
MENVTNRRVSRQHDELLGNVMRTPEEVAAMLQLHELGWGLKRIAREFGCSRNTVRRYLELDGWTEYRSGDRPGVLSDHEAWVAERFRRHRGNCAVVRQDLEREKGIVVSLRTVERAVAPLRQGLRAEASATVRFETAPGQQLQVDFGEVRLAIGSDRVVVYLLVATLGWSRRSYVQAFRHERQAAWFEGLEGAFHRFGGVTAEVLLDNPRALVLSHDRRTREIVFNERLVAFARYWGFVPRACAPYRARTKGKVERGVGYVKHNAIAGHEFASWNALEAHLAWWMREVADVRVHGTTGEVPLERFRRDEAARLRPLNGRPPFGPVREVTRRVQADCSIEFETNAYSVPWRLIGEEVHVAVSGSRVVISHAGKRVAMHAKTAGRHQRIVDPVHVEGLRRRPQPVPPPTAPAEPALLRPLSDYEALIGGGW